MIEAKIKKKIGKTLANHLGCGGPEDSHHGCAADQQQLCYAIMSMWTKTCVSSIFVNLYIAVKHKESNPVGLRGLNIYLTDLVMSCLSFSCMK